MSKTPDFQINDGVMYTSLRGKTLLSIPQLNKGTAFDAKEREALGLLGKLPHQVETLEEQVERVYQQYNAYNEPLNRNIFLNRLLNTNLILFYALIDKYIEDMLPIIYTPIVGTAVQAFHRKFNQPRGLYIAYPDRHRMQEILANRTQAEIQLIVCTDGEGVLGIGDQGISAMAIAIAKLTVYSAFGKVDPMKTLPIMLDVGTNNPELLNDPMYPGWRSPRIEGAEYDAFIDQFVNTVRETFPSVFLHWEDLGRDNAQRCLDRYREKICTFNDDIEGTGVVSLAAVLSAIKRSGQQLSEQRIIIFGAGTAGMGVCQQIYNYMIEHGLSDTQAREKFWLVDRGGLLTTDSAHMTDTQKAFLRPAAELGDRLNEKHSVSQLFTLISHIKPTILIGCSAQAGAFNQSVVTEMAKHCKRPIILPLSNPNEKAEATPADLFRWTDGQVITATGSPFPPILHQGESIQVSQCNNYLVFPGIGLGVISIGATRVSTGMLQIASETLANHLNDQHTHQLLPRIDEAVAASKAIAIAVATQAQKEGLATHQDDAKTRVEQTCWHPHYLPYEAIDT